jgi:hypothetical protein
MSNPNEKSVAKSQRKQFDSIPRSEHVRIRAIKFAEISRVAQFASEHLPSLKLDDLSVFQRIVALDGDSIQIFEAGGEIVGLYAMLFLNRQGHCALVEDNFNGADPDIGHLALNGEKPAAIYTWFVACPGRAVTGFGNVAELLQGERFAHADLYARPASAAGLRLMLGIGYEPIRSDPNGLHRYTRILNRPQFSEQAA